MDVNITKVLKLYLVTNRYDYSDEEFLGRIEKACQNGVTLVQLREKEVTTHKYFELATKVKEITDRFRIPLIIDDRIDICQAVDAAGVHIGDNDLPISVARRLIGPEKILGVSAKSVMRSTQAELEGADYLGVGAIYPTKTKVITKPTSIETLKEITRTVSIPVIAIGGIKQHTIHNFKNTEINGVAMVSEIMCAENIADKVSDTIKALDQVL
ncbi:thiamine phosphate synthase [Leuconostoc mesenteroides]|uniref:thiamine phosphate synthase n=1 Tax=Leuconostoc mesenteroides TaxID=1245 RepID=UPI001CC0519C|nr:thiamine phosphate synthase [Leuconostoc mesenteroides]MBZ1510826.1 thiamine phosphate synthase [Leuconostoc mesenteroides]